MKRKIDFEETQGKRQCVEFKETVGSMSSLSLQEDTDLAVKIDPPETHVTLLAIEGFGDVCFSNHVTIVDPRFGNIDRYLIVAMDLGAPATYLLFYYNEPISAKDLNSHAGHERLASATPPLRVKLLDKDFHGVQILVNMLNSEPLILKCPTQHIAQRLHQQLTSSLLSCFLMYSRMICDRARKTIENL